MKNIVCLTFCLFAGFANAGVILDRAAFEASLGASVNDDYENASYMFVQSDSVMSGVLGETQYNTTGHSNNNLVFESGGEHYYCAGCNGSFLLDFTNTSVGTSDGVFGVGFDFFNQSSPLYYALVSYGDGSIENIAFNQVAFLELEFWGITSNLLISSIHFGLVDGGATSSGSFGLDNLTIGSAAVSSIPAPASIALLSLGLVGICFTRKKKST